MTGLYEVSTIDHQGISYIHSQNKILVEFNSNQGSWVFSDMKNQQMASIKVEDQDANYLPTHGLGTVIKLNRRSGSLIIGHTFEFIPTPDPVGKYLSEENSAELREQNLELVNENFKLRNKIKELEDLINQDKLKDAWYCQICMEDDQIRLVLGCGHSVCDECEELIDKCPFCDTRIKRDEVRRLFDG